MGETSSQTTEPVFKEFPGIFGAGPEGKRIATTLESLLGRGTASPFSRPLEESILNPRFGPQSTAESGLLQSLAEMTQGTSAARGLGPATPGGLAQALAPTLVGLRQQSIENLQRGTSEDIGRQLQQRGIDIQGLLGLGGLAMPQIVGGQKTEGSSGGISFGDVAALGSLGLKLAPFLCWVADELFGKGSEKARYARFYANSHKDNFFMKIYAEHGKAWAKWLKKHRWARPFVKPIWEFMAYRGKVSSKLNARKICRDLHL